MLKNIPEKNIIPVQKGDYLKFVHRDNNGQITVETITRVQKIDTTRGMLALRFPDNEYSNMNITEMPFTPPIIRGTVGFLSLQEKIDGIDRYSRINDNQVPDEIKCRLDHQT